MLSCNVWGLIALIKPRSVFAGRSLSLTDDKPGRESAVVGRSKPFPVIGWSFGRTTVLLAEGLGLAKSAKAI
jgi:hypothetical protein